MREVREEREGRGGEGRGGEGRGGGRRRIPDFAVEPILSCYLSSRSIL